MQACAWDKAPGKDATRMLSNPILNTEKASESSFIWPQQRKTWNRERKGLRKRDTEEKYSKFVLLMKGPSIWSGWYIFTFWYIDLILSDFVINSFSSRDWKPQEEFTFFFNFYFFICSEFCHTLKWNSHGFTCVPHPDPPPTSLSTRSL